MSANYRVDQKNVGHCIKYKSKYPVFTPSKINKKYLKNAKKGQYVQDIYCTKLDSQSTSYSKIYVSFLRKRVKLRSYSIVQQLLFHSTYLNKLEI